MQCRGMPCNANDMQCYACYAMLHTMRRTAVGRSGVPRAAWACDEKSHILTSLTARYQIVSAISISHDHADVFLWTSALRAAGGGPLRIYRACILYAAGHCWPPPLALTFAGTRPRERSAGQKHSLRRVSNCRWPALPHQASWAQRYPSDSIHRCWSQSSPCSTLPSTRSRGRKYPSPRTDHQRDSWRSSQTLVREHCRRTPGG